MKLGGITIIDIAKALGVSASTVSRALRDSHEINPETKKAILSYSEKYNYRPNNIAKSLKGSKSKVIGVVLPEVANHFFSQAVAGIEAIAYNKGYHVVISQSHESSDKEVLNIDQLVSRRVDGLLISLSSQTNDVDYLKALQDQGLPIVFFDRVPEKIITHKVTANNFKGSYQVTKHLITSGYRKIAHITSSSFLSITKERLEGYKTALKEHDISFNEEYVKYCNWGGMVDFEIEEAITDLLNLPEPPDALFAASDRLTTGSLAAIGKANLKVPQDLALVGFTNLNVAELLYPSLTSVVQPAFGMGQMATDLLIQLIEAPGSDAKFETRILDTELFIRNSSISKVAKEVSFQPKEITIVSEDEKFLKKLVEVMEKNISETDFNVDKMAGMLNHSHVQFIRKAKQLTGKRPIDLLTVFRLQRAKQLLDQEKLTISEISYMVGYNLPNSFSRAFRKEFGISPSEYLYKRSEELTDKGVVIPYKAPHF